MTHPRLFYSISEVCDLIGVSRATVARALARGELRSIHVGRIVRISAEALAEWTASLESSPREPVLA